MACCLSEQYVCEESDRNHLLKLQDEAFEDIQTCFGPNITYGMSPSDFFYLREKIQFDNPETFYLVNYQGPQYGGQFLDIKYLVYILDNQTWIANQRLTGRSNNRGRYIFDYSMILLHENGHSSNSWCKKTLIHEIIHSVSLYSRIWNVYPRIVPKHRKLIEGIAECLTGYVLLKRHPFCFGGWKSNNLARCSISYQEDVRLWCSLSQCIGISSIANFYLSQENSIFEPWNQLIQSINDLGYSNFTFSLDPYAHFYRNRFIDVCIEHIDSFEDIFTSNERSLDFSAIDF